MNQFVFCCWVGRMLPQVLLGENPLYAVVSVAGNDYVLWTHVRNKLWLVGLTDVEHVYQEVFDVVARHKADEPNTSQQNYLGHFADAVLASSSHVEPGRDGGVVLSVWRYGPEGTQVRAEYPLRLLDDPHQRTRIVLNVAVEMAKLYGKRNVAEDEDVKKLRLLCERQEKEIRELRRASVAQTHDGDGDGPNWNLGATARRNKPKRDVNGAPTVNSPKKRAGRDLVNPSQPAPKKGKAIQYKGLPDFPQKK